MRLPSPCTCWGTSKGVSYPPQELTRKFAHALFVRTTNRYGCVTLHRSHFYVDQGLPQTPVLLWVSGEDLRAVYDQVLVAEYHCHYDLRTRQVTHLRLGQWYPSPFAARQAQGALLERTPQDSRSCHVPSRCGGPSGSSVAGRAARALCRAPDRLKEDASGAC